MIAKKEDKVYSHRQWSSLTDDFYLKRLQIYFDLLEKALNNNSDIKIFD